MNTLTAVNIADHIDALIKNEVIRLRGTVDPEQVIDLAADAVANEMRGIPSLEPLSMRLEVAAELLRRVNEGGVPPTTEGVA